MFIKLYHELNIIIEIVSFVSYYNVYPWDKIQSLKLKINVSQNII